MIASTTTVGLANAEVRFAPLEKPRVIVLTHITNKPHDEESPGPASEAICCYKNGPMHKFQLVDNPWLEARFLTNFAAKPRRLRQILPLAP